VVNRKFRGSQTEDQVWHKAGPGVSIVVVCRPLIIKNFTRCSSKLSLRDTRVGGNMAWSLQRAEGSRLAAMAGRLR